MLLTRPAVRTLALLLPLAACGDPEPLFSDCDPGETRAVECGLNGRGLRQEVCASYGAWAHSPGDFCSDPDECVDAELRTAGCEASDLAARAELCVDGAWEPAGPCEAISFDAGQHHGCAARAGGELLCWGRNLEGQLGPMGNLLDQAEPVYVAWDDVAEVYEVSAGAMHTCALRELSVVSETRVLCWGRNYDGQVGNGRAEQRQNFPAYVDGLKDAVALGAGYHHTCAVREGGEVVCWGSAHAGALGDGEIEGNALTPVSVLDLEDALAVSASNSLSCALRASGRVACWGWNELGQLGNGVHGEDEHEATPVEVLGISDAIAVSVGNQHGCALREGGGVRCWGRSHSGELGNDEVSVLPQPVPVDVTDLDDAIAISAGGSHTCALREGGEVVCWGRGFEGQLGAGEEITSSRVPVAVVGVDDFVAVRAGDRHTCALRASGEARCWGEGEHGQLGDGAKEASFTPRIVRVPPRPSPDPFDSSFLFD